MDPAERTGERHEELIVLGFASQRLAEEARARSGQTEWSFCWQD
jgi:hypothetical protein